MSEKLIKPSKLKNLLNLTEARSYKLKFLSSKIKLDQYLLLKQDTIDDTVTAKLVTNPHNGQITLWPTLCQENLNPLLEIITNGDNLYVFISPFIGKSLRDCIMQSCFIYHPKCFERKKMYAKDILKGLDFLHGKNFCLLNLRAENVQVCGKTDRAVISDFSMLSFNDELPSFKGTLSGIVLPPELDDAEGIQGTAIDMWCFGILCLQIFTCCYLPMSKSRNKLLNLLNFEALQKANCGSCLAEGVDICVKQFIEQFLQLHPDLRMRAEEGLKANFLCHSSKRLDESARDYWTRRDKILMAKEINRKKGSRLDSSTGAENPAIRIGAQKNSNTTIHQNYQTKKGPTKQKESNSSMSTRKGTYSIKSLPPLHLVFINLPQKSSSCPNLVKKSSRCKVNDQNVKDYDAMKSSLVKEVKYSVVSSLIKNKVGREKTKSSHSNLSSRTYRLSNNSSKTKNSTSNDNSNSMSNDSLNEDPKEIFFDSNIIDDSYSVNIECSKYLQKLDQNFKKPPRKPRRMILMDNKKVTSVPECDIPLNGGFLHNNWYRKNLKIDFQTPDVNSIDKNIIDLETPKDLASKSSPSRHTNSLHSDWCVDCNNLNIKPSTSEPELIHSDQNSRSLVASTVIAQYGSAAKAIPFSVIITKCCPNKKKNRKSKNRKSKKPLPKENEQLNSDVKNSSKAIFPGEGSSESPDEEPLIHPEIKKSKGTWSYLFCPGKSYPKKEKKVTEGK